MDEKYVTQKERFVLAFKQRMAWIILTISAVGFAFKEVLNLERTGLDVLSFLMSIGVTYMFTVYVAIAMRKMGKKSGKENPLYMASLKNLKEAKDSVQNIVYMTPVFCRIKNTQALKEVRRNTLEEFGMKFSLWEQGFYEKPEVISKLDKEQQKCLEEIKNIKISTLTSNQLLSEHSSKKVRRDPLYLGKDEATDNFQSSVSIMLTKLFIPIVFSYFTVNVILGMNILWGIIQTSIIMLIGFAHYMDGEEFVLTELRNRYINKADLLLEFRSLYDNRHVLFSDEEAEFDKIEQEIAKSPQTPTESYKLKAAEA
jgi:hypothetical protein